MSNQFTSSINFYNRLEKIYTESVFKNLSTPSEEIKLIIIKLLEEKDIEYSLKKQNSVYDTKFYSVKVRVKEPQSFYEKLIRKELGIKLLHKLNIPLDNSDIPVSKKGEVIMHLNALDDIIGLRIVTELKNDCKNVYNLLRNSSDVFIASQIKFLDIEDQPQTMRNGLEIYRIKGTYQDIYGFELQIKSKIDEAWGDLDHTLFYKDYNLSPIKDTIQVTMNNVGELLDKIEKLLFGLRDSGVNYSEKAEYLNKQILLEDELGSILKSKLNAVYSLKEISIYLNFFREELNVGSNKLVDISFDYLNLNVSDELVTSYIIIRNKSITLQVLEGIYINWYELVNESVNSNNIDTILQGYIELFVRFICLETECEDYNEFYIYFNSLISYKCSPHIFLKIRDHLTAKFLSNRIDAISIDSSYLCDAKESIKKLFFVCFFNGKYEIILNQIQSDEIEVSNVLLEVKDATKDCQLSVDKLIYDIAVEILDKLTE